MIVFQRINKTIQKIYNDLYIKRKGIQLGRGVIINGRLLYRGKKNGLTIGEGTIINSGDYVIPIGYHGKCTFWTIDDGNIIIGHNCGLTNVSLCSKSKITIGDNVLLGGGVKIYDTDFHSSNYLLRRDILNDHDRKAGDVVIDNDVFIGAGAIVLKGTHIGQRSIIGAGSVVSGVIPSDEIWAGNPAKFIKKL